MDRSPSSQKLSGVPSLGELIADADEAGRLGRISEWESRLRRAAQAYPADKEPWMHLARCDIACKKYRDALTNALEVLSRDSQDQDAVFIVVVCGLQIAIAAVAEMEQDRNWKNAPRRDVQELVAQLCVQLADPVLMNTDVRSKVLSAMSSSANAPVSPVKSGKASLLDKIQHFLPGIER